MPRRLNDWLDTYRDFTSDILEAPDNFHAWIGLYVLASAVRRNIYIDRKQWKVFPNLYIGIIGPTGDGKTTAGDQGIKLLDAITKKQGIELRREKMTSWFILHRLEKLVQSKGNCMMSIYAPEMKTFLGDLNKTELVALLTSLFTSPEHTEYSTKEHDVYKFKNVCINLLACSTPEWLTVGTTTDEISGGFTGRFVYVYSDGTDKSIPFPEDFWTYEKEEQLADLKDDLDHIAQVQGKAIITEEATAAYAAWYNKLKGGKAECRDERLRGYYARKRDLILKVAMLMSVARDDSLLIDEDILNKTWALLRVTEANMGSAFSGVSDDPALRHRESILAQITKAPGRVISREELLHTNFNRFDHLILDRIMEGLQEAGIVTTESRKIEGRMQVLYKVKDVRRVGSKR